MAVASMATTRFSLMGVGREPTAGYTNFKT